MLRLSHSQQLRGRSLWDPSSDGRRRDEPEGSLCHHTEVGAGCGQVVGAPGPLPPAVQLPPPDPSASLVTALQEQLGLKLQPQNEPVQVLVIEHVEQPSEK